MKRKFGVLLACIACVALASCNRSSRASQEATATALEALAATQTQSAAEIPSATVPPTNTPTETPTGTPTATFTPTATSLPSNTPLPCDKVGFVDDITIPDGTEIEPGTTFTKTWRLRNDGSCNWTPDYRLVFASGNAMGGTSPQAFTTEWVYPGYEINVSIELTAPTAPGTYTGYWNLQNASGGVFGIPPLDYPFYVQIVVPGAEETDTPTEEPTSVPTDTG